MSQKDSAAQPEPWRPVGFADAVMVDADAADAALSEAEGARVFWVDVAAFAGSTPGPWHIIGDAGHPANIRVTSTQKRHIAKIYAESTLRDLACEANAALIAAAPTLLTALEAAAKELAALRSAALDLTAYHAHMGDDWQTAVMMRRLEKLAKGESDG